MDTRRQNSFLALPILLAATVVAASLPTAAAEVDLGFDVGLRSGELDWSIAGDTDGQNPDVLSELTWSNLGILQIGLDVDAVLGSAWVLDGYASYGFAFEGDNQDSDFAGDGRTLEWSRSNNNAQDSEFVDLYVSGGYRFDVRRPGAGASFAIVPRIGLAYLEQDLHMTDGNQTLSRPELAPPDAAPPPLGPFYGLDSSYRAEWRTQWLGLDADWRLAGRSRFLFAIAYHKGVYDAVADWNLREDFEHPRSFEQSADGEAWSAVAEWRFEWRHRSEICLRVRYEDWSTDPGIDVVYLSDGTSAGTQLNPASWRSLLVSAGLSFDLMGRP